MTKRDQKRQRSRARSAAVGAQRAANAGVGADTKKTRAPAQRSLTGLQWLAAKNRLNKTQKVAGEAYGVKYRADLMGGADPLRSCLDISPRGGGSGIPITPGETLAWIAESRTHLAAARAELGYHSGMVAVCDLICGQQLTPREITADQREAAEIETTLRLSLDRLYSTFKDLWAL